MRLRTTEDQPTVLHKSSTDMLGAWYMMQKSCQPRHHPLSQEKVVKFLGLYSMSRRLTMFKIFCDTPAEKN